MDRLLDFLRRDSNNNATLCMAGERAFCRLGTNGRWSITKGEFPYDAGREVHFSCIGYGATYEEAISEAFTRLPG